MEGMKKTQLMLFASIACLTSALVIHPAPGGGGSNQKTAEDQDARFGRTTDTENAAMRFDALESNTTGSDSALASWNWKVTDSLNTDRYLHTATLLENGMVLVAGGADLPSRCSPLASAELYDPLSHTWTDTGSLNNVHLLHTATL